MHTAPSHAPTARPSFHAATTPAPNPHPMPPDAPREEPDFVDEPDLPQSEPTELPDLDERGDAALPPEPSPESSRQPGQDDPKEEVPTGALS